MSTYKESGVDIEAGDRASALAYAEAARTFAARTKMIGIPMKEEGGFGGLLDMGDHYLVLTSDGTGSKMGLALKTQKYTTLGWDLLAMVADDMICTGAETIAVTNTFDVPAVYPMMTQALMQGLADACIQQKICIPAGEIAEVPSAVTEPVWNATAVGLVEKDKVLQPASVIPGDIILALKDACARSNGFSLIRKVLKGAHGDEWFMQSWRDGQTWGDVFLTPSVIYSAALLELLGRFKQPRRVNVKALAHITGGGIPGKLGRVLKHAGLGAELSDLWKPHDALRDVIDLGKVKEEEAYRTWHMGQGMMVIVDPHDADNAEKILAQNGIEVRRAGTVVKDPTITITSFRGTKLTYPISRKG